jgi:two-component system CheB/CheR fusion protein
MKKKSAPRKSSSPKPAKKKNVSSSKSPISKKSDAELAAKEKTRKHAKPFPIVGIGASAGGLEAVSELLKKLPPDTGMAYVYVQHLDPTHQSMLSSILSRVTKMKVQEAEEHMRIEMNKFYILPPNKEMHIIDGVLTLDPRPPKPEVHMPINRFFQSLAEKQQEGSIGVVLSGNANDGALGLKMIKMAGGITFAQDNSAKFQSMPRSAIMEGGVDLVLSPGDIAVELARLSNNATLMYRDAEEEEVPAPDDEKEHLVSILELLKKSTGVDFMHYKKSTIRRRIIRRVLLYKLESMKDYAQYLKQHAQEINILYQDLLINVTSFFRDPETIDYLRTTLLPKIIKSKSINDPIRIWVPACSTGEEAYSMAIILMETLGERAPNTAIQIFATDLSEPAITKARIGLYTKEELENVSPKLLQKYFMRVDGNYRVIKSIRDLCVFAPHNIFKDPPFSRIDLVSCCNLLIYLDTLLQNKIINLFHYALNPSGYLILGKSETIGTAQGLFTPLSKGMRIFQKHADSSNRAAFELSYRGAETAGVPQRTFQTQRITLKDLPVKEPIIDFEKTVDKILLSRFVPASVLVNSDFEILQFRGSTGKYLEPAPGRASLNLLKMAKSGLSFELRNAIHKARKTKEPYKKSGILVKSPNSNIVISLEVVPLMNFGEDLNFLILFNELEMHKEHYSRLNKSDKRVKELEQELSLAREDMRSIIEEQEAVNEELQSANEEIVSSNEELQSINEELETSKEEVESTNEELLTINHELQVRNEQLGESYEYADSVFSTIRESIVLLDPKLRVKSANQVFYRTFNLREDLTEGANIYDLSNGIFDLPKLHELFDDIIPNNKQYFGFEVDVKNGGRTEKTLVINARRIIQKVHQKEFILLAIEDITEHREGQKIITEREKWFRNIANGAPVMIWTSDAEGNRNFFNNTWLEFTGKKLEEEMGMGWVRDVNPIDRDTFLNIYKQALKKQAPYRAEYRLVNHSNQYRWVLSEAKPVFDGQQNFAGFIGTVTEIHEQRMQKEKIESGVKIHTHELEELNETLSKNISKLKTSISNSTAELKTFLSRIGGNTDHVLDDSLSELGPESVKKLEDIHSLAEKMRDVLEKISALNQ